MDDYISREAAVKIAQKYRVMNGSTLGRHTWLADRITSEIEKIPAADVEPVRHGRWVPTSKALPPEDQTVLIYNDCDRHYYLGKIDSASKNGPVLFAERGGYPYHYGKYWMSIPSLPEE